MGPAHVEWMYTCSRVFCAWQRLLCRKFHHLWQGRCWTPTRGELYQHSVLKSVFTSLRLFPYRNCVFSFCLQIVENWGELAEVAGVFLNLVMLWNKNDFPFYLVKTSSEFIHLLKFIMNSGVYLAHIKSSLHSKQ